MSVERSQYHLEITTSFARASDLHTFGVKEPGYTVPTFRISWSRERPRVIRIVTARDTATREKWVGTCRLRRARDDGPGATQLSFTVPAGCLWIYEFEKLPRYKVDQRSFDVVDGVKRLDDELDRTRLLTRRR